MNRITTLAGIGLLLSAGLAQAAGPLLMQETDPPRPFAWDMTQGPVPVYTDGGGAFTYALDGITPFITIARANEITQFAFSQWSSVPTSRFRAAIAGTIESQTGIADITAENAAALYEAENGRGVWVIYDTDGSILENYFGVPRDAVLGIAFPEWADDNGHITEATAVMNGWMVSEDDPQAENFAGVFTHEFGHAINLSHSQVNGPLVYSSYRADGYDRYPGRAGLRRAGACVEPLGRRRRQSRGPGDHRDDVSVHRHLRRRRQGTEHDQPVGRHRRHLEPVSDRRLPVRQGSISGVLRLKDERTQYSGINVIARNVRNPLFDAVSAMTGDQTQGRIGPDGRFKITNLTPGQDYELYIEEIYAGGYPDRAQHARVAGRILGRRREPRPGDATGPAT